MWYPATVVLSLFVVFANGKFAPTVRLNNGYEIPVVGLGTYSTLGYEGENAIKDAIDIGYRHIDTAYLYENEREVGNAVRAKIADGTIRREDIFVTTKLWSTFHEPEWVESAFNKSFDNLNLGYIDLYLIHTPDAYQRVLKSPYLSPYDVDSYELLPMSNGRSLLANVDYLDTWRAMERLVESGRVRSIGISNFDAQQTQRILTYSRIKPVTNQVASNPRKNEKALIAYTLQNGMTFTAHTPLGRPASPNDYRSPISNPNILALAQKYNKSPAQVILRYTYQNGAIVIPKSTKRSRLEENIDFFDFSLSPSDMAIIDSLNEG